MARKSWPVRSAIIAGALGLLALLSTNIDRPSDLPAALVRDARIAFDALPLDRSAPARAGVRRLAYLGGWHLHSAHVRFGGISGLHVADGRITALTDSGFIFRFPVPAAASGWVRSSVEPLLDGPGSAAIKDNRDTEAIAVADGRAWVGYELGNMIWRYRLADLRAEAWAAPPAMKRWRRNGGSEALVRLRDGRFLVFAERARVANGSSELLMFQGDPTVVGTSYRTFRFRPPSGFAVTDAAELPDGRLLILTRRLTYWGSLSIKLVVAELPGEGPMLRGWELATIKAPLNVDNMEALSVTTENGATIVWIASDDNFSPPMQRTLLLKFALVGRPVDGPGIRRPARSPS